MKMKRIISLLIAISSIVMCIPSYAQTTVVENNSNEVLDKNIIAKDDFSNGLSLWNKETGSGFYVINKKLVFDNMSNRMNPSTVISKNLAVDNGEIEFVLNAEKGKYVGCIFRMQDDKTLYTLRLYYNINKAILLKRVKGGEYITLKEVYMPLEYNKDYKVGITLIGENIEVNIDREKIMNVKDKSLKSGKVGFEGFMSKATVDYIDIFRYDGVQYDIAKEDEIKESKKLYVSLTGNDATADGTEANPYKTIAAAKKAANRIKRGNTPVDVIFSGGKYPVTETISFGPNDSGSETAPIRYMAKEGEKVVFSGATQLDTKKFKPVSEEIKPRLYEHVREKLVQIDLEEQGIPKNLADFTRPGENGQIGSELKPLMITLNGSEQSLARWPNSGYNTILSCDPGDTVRNNGNKENGGAIYYSEINPTRWKDAERLYIEGFFGNDWFAEWTRVDNVDTYNNAINMRYYTQYGFTTGRRWAAINLLEEIDVPGEWYIDPDKMLLYYYPPRELTENDVFEIATLKTNMVNISGAENVIFEGIEFTMTADDPAVIHSNTTGGNGIYIAKNSKNIVIKDCIISHIGMNGILMDSTDITVDGCVIYDTGFAGMRLEAGCGNGATLTPSNITIKNCDISEPGRDTGLNGIGGIVLKEGTVDVNITNNVIHNCENSAIVYHGNGHQMLYNEIYDVVRQTADAGAIYTGRSWVEYGTAVKYNFFHDIGQKIHYSTYNETSIFWDDYHAGNEFSYNISVMNNDYCTASVKLGGGVDNIVKANTMVASEYDILGEDRSSSQLIDWKNQAMNYLKMSTAPFDSPAYVAKYPKMATLLPRLESNNNTLKIENTIVDNLTVNCNSSRIASTLIEASEYRDNVTLTEDEGIFVNPEKLDYRVTKAAKEKYNISEEILDEDFDINKIGIINGYKPDKERMKFSATYPHNGTSGIEKKNVILAWEKSQTADSYRYVIASDSDFKNIVLEDVTEYTSVKVDGLENGKTYYWKVYAKNDSRQFGCEIESDMGVMSFQTSETDTLDKTILDSVIERANTLLENIVEGNGIGQYKSGTISAIEEEIRKTEAVAALTVGLQSDVDKAAYDLNYFINNIDSYVNCGYTTLNLTAASEWFSTNADTVITTKNDAVHIDFGGPSEISLMETLSNYNVMCFRTKIGTLENTWVSYGLRVMDKNRQMFAQDAYYILVKPDIFELQKHGKIYATAPNNGKLKAGEWYDIQFGTITTENGINMLFVLNGEVIFDYLDKTDPQHKPGMFAVYAGTKGQVIEIEDAKIVPEGLYQMSDKILAEISQRDEDTKTYDVSGSEYVEKGAWNDSLLLKGENNSKVRESSEKDASAKWIMESGAAGNEKLYKVSYYHIPSVNGDKAVKVKFSGYAGEYETTIDLSQGEEGYVELGTFIFMAADNIGRLSVEFIGSGEGNVNVSNVKYELVDESKYSNMLK